MKEYRKVYLIGEYPTKKQLFHSGNKFIGGKKLTKCKSKAAEHFK